MNTDRRFEGAYRMIFVRNGATEQRNNPMRMQLVDRVLVALDVCERALQGSDAGSRRASCWTADWLRQQPPDRPRARYPSWARSVRVVRFASLRRRIACAAEQPDGFRVRRMVDGSTGRRKCAVAVDRSPLLSAIETKTKSKGMAEERSKTEIECGSVPQLPVLAVKHLSESCS